MVEIVIIYFFVVEMVGKIFEELLFIFNVLNFCKESMRKIKIDVDFVGNVVNIRDF